METKRLTAAWTTAALLLCAATPAIAGNITAQGEVANARVWAGRPCLDCDAAPAQNAAVAKAPLLNQGRSLLRPAGVGFRAARPAGFRYERPLLAANVARFDSPAATAARYAGLR